MATKGIWVSAEIMQDTNLSVNEKFILAEIGQLSSLDDGCYAHNKHFATLIGTTTRTVTRAITTLQEKGYIKVDTKPGTRNHVRELSTIDKLSNPPRQNVQTPTTNCLETKGNKQLNKQKNKQEAVLIPDWISVSAWSQWVEYRKEIKKKLTTSTIKQQIKFLSKHIDDHIEIIEQSIQNGWTGLFEMKSDTVKEKTPLKLKSFMDMKEYLTNNLEAIRHIDITYSNQLWKIGKGGIPYSKERIDDMPFDERKGFWLWLLNNKDILAVSA